MSFTQKHLGGEGPGVKLPDLQKEKATLVFPLCNSFSFLITIYIYFYLIFANVMSTHF